MRNRLLCLFMLLIMLSASVANAQDMPATGDERWFWAWRENSGELVAYNADGESSIVLSGVETASEYNAVHRSIRLDSQRMLAVMKVDGVFGLYKLGANRATLLDPLANIKLTDYGDIDVMFGLDFVFKRLPYVVMYGQYNNFLLVNVDTDTVTTFEAGTGASMCELYAFVHSLKDCMGISRDGTKLRYVMPLMPVLPDVILQQWALVERDLTTGEEHVFFSIDDSKPPDSQTTRWWTGCLPDTYGDRWLCWQFRRYPEREVRDYFLVDADGTQQMILKDAPYADSVIFGYDNEIVVFPSVCESGCHFDVYPANGQPVYTVTVQEAENFYPFSSRYFRRFDNGRMIIAPASEHYTLSNGGEPVFAGSDVCCETYDFISPDRRWLISEMYDGSKFLWDMETGRQITKFEADPFFAAFLEYGIVQGTWAYFFGEDEPLKLSAEYKGKFFNILADRALLFYQFETNKNLHAGIYRYNPATDEMDLLVADAQPLTE